MVLVLEIFLWGSGCFLLCGIFVLFVASIMDKFIKFSLVDEERFEDEKIKFEGFSSADELAPEFIEEN